MMPEARAERRGLCFPCKGALRPRRRSELALDRACQRSDAWLAGGPGIGRLVDVSLMVAGALFVIWPLQYRRSIGGSLKRIGGRDGDTARFDHAMDRRWIRVALVVAPITGVVLIVVGITS